MGWHYAANRAKHGHRRRSKPQVDPFDEMIVRQSSGRLVISLEGSARLFGIAGRDDKPFHRRAITTPPDVSTSV